VCPCARADEFVEAFLGILKPPQEEGATPEEGLRKLFARIDANCDGGVDWSEGQLLLQLQLLQPGLAPC